MMEKGQEAPPVYHEGNVQQQGPYQGYQPYPGQPQCPQPTTTVVVVNQPMAGQGPQDYTFENGRAPGGILIFVAVANLLAYIIMGAIYPYRTGWGFSDAVSAFVFYLVPGILGVVGANKQQSSGVAIGCIVMSSIGLCVTIGQFFARCTNMIWRGGNFFWIGHLVIILLALVAFCCLISLIVYASKVVCCRPAPEGMVYQQHSAGQPQYHAQLQMQPGQRMY